MSGLDQFTGEPQGDVGAGHEDRLAIYRRERAVWMLRMLVCFVFGLYGSAAGANPVAMFLPALAVCLARLIILARQD